MNCYIVVATGLTADQLTPHCRHQFNIQAGAWMVATSLSTCSDLAEALGMNAQQGTAGVVVRVGDYYGYYDKSLWEKIEAWRLES